MGRLLGAIIAILGVSAAEAQPRGADGNLVRNPSAGISINRNVYGNLTRQSGPDQQPKFHPNARRFRYMTIR